MTAQPKDPANPTDGELRDIEMGAQDTAHDAGVAPYRILVAGRHALYTAGRASREPEIEALRAELKDWDEAVGANADTPHGRLLASIKFSVETVRENRARAEKAEAELVEVKAELLDYQKRWGAEQREVARLRANSFAAVIEALERRAVKARAQDMPETEWASRHCAGWLAQQLRANPDYASASPRSDGKGRPLASLTPAASQSPQPAEAHSHDPPTDFLGCAQCDPPRSPPFETSPRLTKGVRYRVVDTGYNSIFCIGHEFVATGLELLDANVWIEDKGRGGWYYAGALRPRSWYRVVRVDPPQESWLKRGLESCEREAAAVQEARGEPAKCERCGGELWQGRAARFCANGDCRGTGEKGEG